MRNRGTERSDFLTVTQLLRSPSAYILKGAKQAKPAFKKLLEGLESRMSTHSEGKFRKIFFFKLKSPAALGNLYIVLSVEKEVDTFTFTTCSSIHQMPVLRHTLGYSKELGAALSLRKI